MTKFSSENRAAAQREDIFRIRAKSFQLRQLNRDDARNASSTGRLEAGSLGRAHRQIAAVGNPPLVEAGSQDVATLPACPANLRGERGRMGTMNAPGEKIVKNDVKTGGPKEGATRFAARRTRRQSNREKNLTGPTDLARRGTPGGDDSELVAASEAGESQSRIRGCSADGQGCFERTGNP